MKKKIEIQIRKEVDYLLSELDIDAEIEKIVSSGEVKKKAKEIIDQEIAKQISDKIMMSIHKALTKNMPIIDAYTDNKVRDLMFKIDEATNRSRE